MMRQKPPWSAFFVTFTSTPRSDTSLLCVARMAQDALAREMQRSRVYSLRADAELTAPVDWVPSVHLQTGADRNLRAAFLGRAEEYAIVGKVASLEPMSRGRSVRLTLDLLVYDVLTQQLVAAVRATGEGRGNDVAPGALGVGEAVTRTARNAVRLLDDAKPARAGVLERQPDTNSGEVIVRLDCGDAARAGFRRGTYVVHLRGRDRIEVLRVLEISRDWVHLGIMDRSGPGLAPGHEVRSISREMPTP